MIILAHRGLWRQDAEKNTLRALREALTLGFGLETDLRDDRGCIVISHAPPTGGEPTLEQFLDLYVEVNSHQPLALNIKSDGLQNGLKKALAVRKIPSNRYFAFDMAVPDALGYIIAEIQCFTRESEVEPLPPFIDHAAGIWLDCFYRDWIDERAILKYCDAGRRVAVVSPELHGRDKTSAWKTWREIYRTLSTDGRQDMMMICTDHPIEARDYFDV
jgi:hypothetical protein